MEINCKNQLKTYFYKDYLIIKLLLGILFFALAMQSFDNEETYIIGILLFFLVIPLLTFRGVEFNLKENEVRVFYYFFNLKFGQWKKMSKFEYLTVFGQNESILLG